MRCCILLCRKPARIGTGKDFLLVADRWVDREPLLTIGEQYRLSKWPIIPDRFFLSFILVENDAKGVMLIFRLQFLIFKPPYNPQCIDITTHNGNIARQMHY
jgi:hypothetical protein